ncbi:MAG: glutamate mutase L [Anaerolineae bacterium]
MTLFGRGTQEAQSSSPEIGGPPIRVKGPILAVDIGTIHTRAVLFDLVDGMYHFVARSSAPTTAAAPWNDVLVGVQEAIAQIAEATGRVLLSDDRLITPAESDFSGVDVFLATSSGGQPVRCVLVGLMPDLSLSSGLRAANSAYVQVVDTLSLLDERGQDQQIDALLGADADLIVIVGGVDGGAVAALRKQINTVLLACSLMERSARPVVIYAGNRDLAEEVREQFDQQVHMQIVVADNVRPVLDGERLEGVQSELAALYHAQKAQHTNGFAEVGEWTRKGIYPTAYAFSRAVHVIGHLHAQDVLGIDLGSTATTIAASIADRQYLNVFGDLGSGHVAYLTAGQIGQENLARWLTYELSSPDDLLNYLMNKAAFPQRVPTTRDELEIEFALAREVIRLGLQQARQGWRDVPQRGPLPAFRTVLLSGGVLTSPPHYGWSVLALLDALMPTAATRLLLDPYGVAPALGILPEVNPLAAVQVLERGAFIDVGTVLSATGRARRGEVVVWGKFKAPEGESVPFEVRYGSIALVPIPYGVEAEVTLRTRFVRVGTGQSGLRRLRIKGGEAGLIIDARGRPWRVPRDAEETRLTMAQWQKMATGEVTR